MLLENNSPITILAYHTVENVEQFNKQLIYISKRYNLINTNQLLDFIEKKASLPVNSLLLTFDDGDRSLYENALPLLKKHQISALIFVVTDLIDTEKPFWWQELKYYLGESEGENKVWQVKSWPNKKRENYLSNLRKNSDKIDLKYLQLTSRELQEMNSAGITIANHSHTHPIFDQCTPEELEEEMDNSIAKLKFWNLAHNLFAYPNGNSNETSEIILKEKGISMAFLFDHKINKALNPLRISRLLVNDNTPMWKFKLILSGWHTKILPITRTLGKLRKWDGN